MATFTSTQVDKLTTLLGYGSVPITIKWQLQSDFNSDAIATVTQLLQTLADIDAKLTDALGKSRIMEADSIKLNPAANVRHLKSEGSRILSTIAAIVGVCVIHDKYRSVNRTSIKKSYW